MKFIGGAYLDLVLLPLGLATLIGYLAILYYKVTTHPYETTIGTNREARRIWVHYILKDNEKKQVLAVQSLRNSILESTVMVMTSIMLSVGLAAYMTYNYSVTQPLDVVRADDRLHVPQSVKLMGCISLFLLSFLSQTQSISLINHVNYMVNIPIIDVDKMALTNYIVDVMDKSFVYCTAACRMFYIGMALVFWVFGSIPVFLGLLILLYFMYRLDFIKEGQDKKGGDNTRFILASLDGN